MQESSQSQPHSLYQPILKQNNFPSQLLPSLATKLSQQTYDIGDKVKLIFDQASQITFPISLEPISANNSVFLIDHAWTFRPRGFSKQLKQNSELRIRMHKLMYGSDKKRQLPKDLEQKKQKTVDAVINEYTEESKQITLDDMQIASLKFVKFPDSLEKLSLWGNLINDTDQLLEAIKNITSLKALWLNQNPFNINNNSSQFYDKLIKLHPSIELLNSQLTTNSSDWVFLHLAREQIPQPTKASDIHYLDLQGRALHKAKIQSFDSLKSIKKLNIKDNLQIWQEGSSSSQSKEGFKSSICYAILSRLKTLVNLILEPDLVPAIVMQKAQDDSFLPNLRCINDQPFKIGTTQQQQQQLKNEGQAINKQLKYVTQNMWKFTQTYRLSTTEKMDEEPCWYIMDEVGSAFLHSDTPNFKFVPILYNKKKDAKQSELIAYTIAWPVRDIPENTPLSRNYVQNISQQGPGFRSSRLAIWYDVPHDFYLKQRQELIRFYNSKRVEYRAKLQNLMNGKNQQIYEKFQKPIKVYTDYPLLSKSLTAKQFQITQNPQQADILYIIKDIQQYKGAIKRNQQKQYINQFPYQSAIVMKHHMAETVQTVYGMFDDTSFKHQKVKQQQEEDQQSKGTNYENLLPIQMTFSLYSQAPAFLGQYFKRQRNGQDNTWIVKPSNMARSLDTIVTNNLQCIIQQMYTSDKIVQKYIQDPLMFRGKKKFDLRFLVIINSMGDSEKNFLPDAYVYGDFWVRVAKSNYDNNQMNHSDMDKHFTVNWYGQDNDGDGDDDDDDALQKMQWREFVKQFQDDYNMSWDGMKKKIYRCLRQVVMAISVAQPRMRDVKGRAIYGVDLMITSQYQPKVLEFTFSPDCKRGVLFNPQFFNDVFKCWFGLGWGNLNVEKLI